MTVLRRFASSAGLLVAQAVFQRLFGLITSILLARGLGPGALGIYSAVVTTGNSVYGFVRLGIDSAIHVLMAEGPKQGAFQPDKSSLLSCGFILFAMAGAFGALATLVLADWIARAVLKLPDLAIWLRVAAILVLIQCITQFFYSALAGLHQFVRYARVMMLTGLLSLVFIGAGLIVDGLRGALAGLIVSQALTAAKLGFALHAAFRESDPPLAYRFHDWTRSARLIVRLGLPVYFAGLVAIPVAYYLQGLLVQHAGIAGLGHLRIIVAINSIIAFVPMSVAAATISTLTTVRTNEEYGRDVFVAVSVLNLKLIWYFSLTAAVAIYFFIPPVIRVMFGAEYADAAASARIAIFSVALGNIMNSGSHVYFAERRVDRVWWMHVVFSAFFAGSGLLLIPQLGLKGYVIAEAMGYGSVCLGVIWLAVKEGRAHRVSMAPMKAIALISAGTAALLVALPYPIARFTWEYSLAAVALVAGLLALGYYFVLSAEERPAIIRLIKRFHSQIMVRKHGD